MALPYELDGHAYDDAERVRDNKRQVTNYCPLCEHCARSAEKLNDENRALREENARLTGELAEIRGELRKHDARDIPITSIEMIRNLTRERDEARAEVARLEGLILDWDAMRLHLDCEHVSVSNLGAEARRIRDGRMR